MYILLNKSFRFSLSQRSGSILLMFSKKNPSKLWFSCTLFKHF